MTTTNFTLMSVATGILQAPVSTNPNVYLTDAGARIYAPRDWPTWDKNYPCIFLSTPSERKTSLGPSGAPEFSVSGTVRIMARVQCPAAPDDGGAGLVEAELVNIQRQIEVALINNAPLMGLISQFVSVETSIGVDSSGAQHLGELRMDFEMEFYQGPEDFFQVTGEPLTEVTLTTQFPTPLGPNVGLDITLPDS